jgi:hypothetical protein
LPASPAKALYWLMGQEEFQDIAQGKDGYTATWGFEFVSRGPLPTPFLALAAAIEVAGEVN